MVARLLRLRLDVLVGAFRGDRAETGRAVVGLAALAAATVLAVVGVRTLGRTADPALAGDAVTVGGGILTLAFLLLPVLFVRPDPLDPRAFRLFDLPRLPLAAGLALASVLSAPVLALTVVAVSVLALRPTVVGVLCLVLQVGTAAVLGRIATAVATATRRSPRAPELLALLGIVLLLGVVPFVVVSAGLAWGDAAREGLRSAARALAASPFGAAWAAPSADAPAGPIALAVLTLLGALAVWIGVVHLLLRAPERTHRRPRPLPLGWFGVLPGVTGAIAARSVSYWLRDPRYQLSLLAVPLLPLVSAVVLASVGVPFGLLTLIPVPLVLLFLGWSLHNDLALDGSAFWLHVASGVRGWADRIGRLFPTLLVGLPLVLIGSVLSSAGSTVPGVLPVVLASNTCILLTAAGVSSAVSALLPYPAPRPGESAFVQPQAPGVSGAGAQTLAFGLGLGLAAPAIVLAVRALLIDQTLSGDAVAWGYGTGALVLVVGVAVGGFLYERRATELVAFTSRY